MIWCYNRFPPTREDKRTPLERLILKTYDHPVLPSGEKLIARITPVGKAQARWVYGFWIGRSTLANDHRVLMEQDGLVRNRAVRRLPPGEAWGEQAKKVLMAMEWTPWEQVPAQRRRRRVGVEVPDIPADHPILIRNPPSGWNPTQRCPGCFYGPRVYDHRSSCVTRLIAMRSEQPAAEADTAAKAPQREAESEQATSTPAGRPLRSRAEEASS